MNIWLNNVFILRDLLDYLKIFNLKFLIFLKIIRNYTQFDFDNFISYYELL